VRQGNQLEDPSVVEAPRPTIPRRKRFTARKMVTLVLIVGVPTTAYIAARPNRCSDTVVLNDSYSDAGQSIGKRFPTVSAKTLAKRCVRFPEETKRKVGLVFVAFEQGAQQDINSWVGPFIGDVLNNDAVSYYEIPMISGAYKPVSRFIDGGMRGGVPKDLHDRTATFYGKRADFFESMAITDQSRAYLFMLSRDGRIVFRTSGPATTEKISAARDALEKELAKS
jgi:ATP10 protein